MNALKRYAIVETATGAVVNVVEYEEQPETPPPGFEAGHAAIQNDVAGPGWTFDGVALQAPQADVVPVDRLPPQTPADKLQARTGLTIDEIKQALGLK